MRLQQGKVYDIKALKFTGWTGNESIYDDQGNRNPGMDGYNVADYFDDNGRYLGPDIHGVEPTFAT